MRIIRFITSGGKEAVYGIQPAEGATEAEVLSLESAVDVATGIPASMMPQDFKPTGRVAKIEKLLSPIMPPNLFAIGLNYREHAAESKMACPVRPVIVMKPTSTVYVGVPALPLPRSFVRTDRVTTALTGALMATSSSCRLASFLLRDRREIWRTMSKLRRTTNVMLSLFPGPASYHLS